MFAHGLGRVLTFSKKLKIREIKFRKKKIAIFTF